MKAALDYNVQKVLLGQTVPYCRKKDACTDADRWGASVVHHDLVRCSLQDDSKIRGVHFFLTPSELANNEEKMDSLRGAFPNRDIRSLSLETLPAAATTQTYFFPVALDSFPKLARIRSFSNEASFPITGILHSLRSSNHLAFYWSSLLLARPYDRVIATSRAGKTALDSALCHAAETLLQKTNGRRRPTLTVTHIPLGVEVSEFGQFSQAHARMTLGLKPDAIYLLYLGRLTERFKADLEPLIRVFSGLQSKYPKLHLLIAGRDDRDDYSRSIYRYLNESGLADRATLMVNFPFAHKATIYSAVDIFVSPVDNIQETFGLSLLEAMATGLPVVASDWSGYRDIVEDQHTGFLVPTRWSEYAARTVTLLDVCYEGIGPTHYLASNTILDIDCLYNSLNVLIGNSSLRKSMGLAGRKRVTDIYDWRLIWPQYLELWTEQRSQMVKYKEDCVDKSHFSVDTMFRHFASQVLEERDLVCLPSANTNTSPKTFLSAGLPNSLEVSLLSSIVAECESAPVEVAKLAQSNDNRMVHLLWLLKKGYLALC